MEEEYIYSEDTEINDAINNAIEVFDTETVLESLCEYIRQKYDDDLWEFISNLM